MHANCKVEATVIQPDFNITWDLTWIKIIKALSVLYIRLSHMKIPKLLGQIHQIVCTHVEHCHLVPQEDFPCAVFRLGMKNLMVITWLVYLVGVWQFYGRTCRCGGFKPIDLIQFKLLQFKQEKAT